MNSLFYPKMAFTSMRKNKAMYLPYLIAVCLCVGVFYIMDSVNVMVAESGMKGAARMSDILVSMRSICGFITLVILFYVNSFVMKRRKKEFGLYEHPWDGKTPHLGNDGLGSPADRGCQPGLRHAGRRPIKPAYVLIIHENHPSPGRPPPPSRFRFSRCSVLLCGLQSVLALSCCMI